MTKQEPAAPMARDERVRLIAERQDMPGRGQPVLFGGSYRFFPIAQVPVEALIYRVDNGRLAAEIEEHAVARGVRVDVLREKAETHEVQQFLHDKLLALARNPQGPIFAELERLAQQTEPLIVLFDGTVINGNRRLSAMRNLLARDPDRYATFRSADIAVLPEGTEAHEIEYVEASLQMAPETKLSYGWVDRRLKLRKQRDVLGLPLDEIKAAYRIEDASEIDGELVELALAEEYLKSFRGEPAHYSAVADCGELFKGLSAVLADLAGSEQAFWRTAGFAMIDGCDGGLQKRMEQLFPFAPPVSLETPAIAQSRLARRLDIEGAAELADDDALTPGTTDALLKCLRDRERSAANAELIVGIVEELRLEQSERKAPERMLQKVREAGKLIARLEPDRLSPAQRRSLRVDLAALMAHGTFLLGEIDERPSVPSMWNYPKAIMRPPYRKVPWRIVQRLGLADAERSGR